MSATEYSPSLLVTWRGDKSREEVARATGLTRMTIWRAENGQGAKLETLAKLAAHYQRPLRELLQGQARSFFAPEVSST